MQSLLSLNNDSLDPKHGLATNSRRTKRGIDLFADALQWCCNTATLNSVKEITENEVKTNGKLNDLLDFVHYDHKQFTLVTQ